MTLNYGQSLKSSVSTVTQLDGVCENSNVNGFKARTFLKILVTVITKITMTENEVGFYTYDGKSYEVSHKIGSEV